MKKVLLFLFALLTTATVWAQEFIPLQMGENNGIELGSNDSDKGYLSFTPEETGYYVISTTCAESHSMALNLWSDSLYYAWSEPDALLQTHVSHCGYPNKLYAGTTYIMRLLPNNELTTSVSAQVVIRPGHIIIPDPECAELSNVMGPLPVVAYEGQEVKLTVSPGVTISGLTATSGGQPVAMTVDESGMVYTFTMPAADVVISGSYEMPSLQMGDNEIDLSYDGTQYAFVPEESGAYVFSMNCGAIAQVLLLKNNDLKGSGYAPAGETVKVGAMLEANETYYVVPMAQVEDVLEGVIFNIAKLELPPLTVGKNVIDVPYGNSFDYLFTPTESGDYRFYTTGDAEIRPAIEIYLGENLISRYFNVSSNLDFTINLEAGVTYTVKASGNPDMPGMSVMHLNVVSPQFAISLPESFEHGTVECDKTTAAEGETVTLTVTPDDGYELENLTVTTVDGEPSGAPLRLRGGSLELTPGENGTYTFQMPAAPVAVTATFREAIATGVEDINVATAKRGQRYNLMGQPVSRDYKGIVIEDGRKRVIK